MKVHSCNLYCFIHTKCFNASSLLLDDPRQPAMSFVDGAAREPLPEFVPLIDDHMLELLD